MIRPGIAGLTFALAAAVAPPARAQSPSLPPADTVTVTPGARYAASGLHRFFFGDHYRDLWTTRIRAPILTLDMYGGLEAVERGGGQQTKSLRLKSSSGGEYSFRSVDKDPSAILPPDLRETIADDIVQDQISAAHPLGAVVVPPILDAVGIAHPTPVLYVMADDPRLGEFREEFGGMLGLLEERQVDVDEGGVPFAGATDFAGTHAVFERLEEHPDERVDAHAFLAARLVDLFLGDWDRHADQWRWARRERDGLTYWEPIPRDRDQAFVKFDGLLLTIARTSYPQLVEFEADYPAMEGLTWNGRVVDRRLLVRLSWADWDSVAQAVRSRITDAVIDAAVNRLPPALVTRDGVRLGTALRRRRDLIPSAAREFYRHLAREVDVHATDDDEVAIAERRNDGQLELAVYRSGKNGRAESPSFRRVFASSETGEVRLYLEGGTDTVVARGGGGGPILRVVGGGGDDVVADSSTGGRIKLYDDRGDNHSVGPRGVGIDARRYDEFDITDSTPYPPRDWGRIWRVQPWLTLGPDVGLFVGGGMTRYRYGFRKQPYASRTTIRAGYATEAATFRAELRSEFRRENSNNFFDVLLRASGIEVVRFHGFGNETPLVDEDEFYRARQEQYILAPSVVLPLAPNLVIGVGPRLKYASTNVDDGRFISTVRPYGTPDFGQVGAEARVALDSRDHAAAATRGVFASVAGSYYPGVWDAEKSFGSVGAEASTYLHAAIPLDPVLALRVGGKRVWGTFPFHEAAFIGGAATVRGLREQRYAGESSAFGNAELRVRLGRVRLLVPAQLGVFGLGDVGRVWIDGESSDRWHTGIGGGLSLAFLNAANTLTLAVASAEERVGIYVRAGFLY